MLSRETEEALTQAESCAASLSGDPVQAIARIGGGWIAEEALGIAVYCALTAQDFADGVIRAVNHSGDSDSTGSITGNILGALWGVEAIPPSFLEPLELREVIAELAQDLAAFMTWDIGEYDDAGAKPDRALQERVRQKYPGC